MNAYFVLDGHLRLKALPELRRTEAFCLITRDNDGLTYNDRVNRLENLETELRAHQDRFGENSLRLNAAHRCVKRLLANARIQRFPATCYTEILAEFEDVGALEAI